MYIQESLMISVESLWNEFQINPRQIRLMLQEGLVAFIRCESFTPYNTYLSFLQSSDMCDR